MTIRGQRIRKRTTHAGTAVEPLTTVQPRWDPGAPLLDVTPGKWLQQRLWNWGPGSTRQGVAVGCLVPEGFEAYARVLHPAWGDTEHGPEPVRWSVIASWTGSTVHPLMQFHRIAKLPAYPGLRAPTWGSVPFEGSLPAAEGERLVASLRAFTATPDRCYSVCRKGLVCRSSMRLPMCPG
jgi:hypothetical protein